MCTKMYSIKPIIKNVHIELPTSMYKMKNILAINLDGTTTSSGSCDDGRKLPAMDQLESRQQTILDQLEELRQQIQLMNKDLNLCSKPQQTSNQQREKTGTKQTNNNVATQTITKLPINLANLQDLVINANPSNVPYGLLALKRIFKDRLNLEIKCRTHSTIPTVSAEATKFVEAIAAESETDDPNLPKLKIDLIWKNVGKNVELNSSSFLYVPIYGEVNILRYLSRVGPNEHNYEKDDKSSEIDTILDTCYQILNGNPKSSQPLIRNLCSRLGKGSNFLVGDQLSVADIALSSTVRQSNFKDLTPNLNKWLQQISKIVGY